MAFVYGWVLLLVTQTGGMAAVAVTFAQLFPRNHRLCMERQRDRRHRAAGADGHQLPGRARGQQCAERAHADEDRRPSRRWWCWDCCWAAAAIHPLPLLDRPVSLGLIGAIGAAMIPVAFAYGGWQTASFVAGEMRDPRRDLSRGLLLGVSGVIVLYLSVNFVCLKVLGPAGLAATATPASAVMRAALGDRGAQWIAIGIAVSTLGFLSQGILTAPRVYYAMARDGLFFEAWAGFRRAPARRW